MRPKLLLVGAAVVAILGVGAAISWGAPSEFAPEVWSHDVVMGPAQPAAGMRAMRHPIDSAPIDSAGVDRMVEICEKAMQRMHDDMMDDTGMMDDDADMMDGGMMGSGGMMGGGRP